MDKEIVRREEERERNASTAMAHKQIHRYTHACAHQKQQVYLNSHSLHQALALHNNPLQLPLPLVRGLQLNPNSLQLLLESIQLILKRIPLCRDLLDEVLACCGLLRSCVQLELQLSALRLATTRHFSL